MSTDERIMQIEAWRQDIMEATIDDLSTLIEDFNTSAIERESLRREAEAEILSQARIIGATTAGAAAYHDLLSSKASGVVLVEEAGEVLESHILTALSCGADARKRSKHLILIGDHKQLPPKVENYELTTTSGNGYNLDCSLFERLVRAGNQSVSLQVRHRMRPSISSLIREQTYPTLVDHKSVTQYPAVKGVTDNLLFINHSVLEDGADNDSSTTKSNEYEANLCVEVVRFLLLQEYRPDQIVVLTPYLGQLLKILAKMKSLSHIEAMLSDQDAEDIEELSTVRNNYSLNDEVTTDKSTQKRKAVRCSSIDNYQGEEADIVIISLVRSNHGGNIGFLRERQRVNVLLSRARHGMFLLGNKSTLQDSNKGQVVWRPILNQLQTAGRVLQGLPSTCQLHPDDDPVLLCRPCQYKEYRPNGGCLRPCRFCLLCGHKCQLMCHPTDRKHEIAQKNCCEPCKRFPPECSHDHECPKLCKESCGPCLAFVGPVILSCGHEVKQVHCHHVRSKEAIESYSTRCTDPVPFRFLCGHESTTTCANSRSDNPKCPEFCGELAECHHPCSNLCGSCEGNHKCHQKCSRILFCGHECGRVCHAPAKCSPCQEKCHMSCPHSTCPQKCSNPCQSCVEPCDWDCVHQKTCPLVCGAPCSRLPCNERCTKKLLCGHQCPSVCGEDCPRDEFCKECGWGKYRERVVDMINLSTYSDHDINADPMVFLPCGHFFAMSTMDCMIGIDNVYEKDHISGSFTGVQSLLGSIINEKAKQCPDCRSIIYSVRRYGRVLRLIELRSLERKHMSFLDQALQTNEERINAATAASTQGGNHKWRSNIFNELEKLEAVVRRSPMRVIYEACGGSSQIESSPPPAKQLIRCLELRGLAHEQFACKFKDKHYCEAKDAYLEGMIVADNSLSRKSGAMLRLSLSRLLLNLCDDYDNVRNEVNGFLNWILDKSELHDLHELKLDAKELKEKLSQSNTFDTIKEVMSAMRIQGGYDYGGAASDHWYECSNGHPYFIGECGGAMEESQCPECGELVGGTGHRLTSNSRQIGGRFRDALSAST